MTLQARISTLKSKHEGLEQKIADEDQRPQPDPIALNSLKLEKLRLKDEMERLHDQVTKTRNGAASAG